MIDVPVDLPPHPFESCEMYCIPFWASGAQYYIEVDGHIYYFEDPEHSVHCYCNQFKNEPVDGNR